MSTVEAAAVVEAKVGVRRQPHTHLARVVPEDDDWTATVYILHSRACYESGIDLRDCLFSRALDRGCSIPTLNPVRATVDANGRLGWTERVTCPEDVDRLAPDNTLDLHYRIITHTAIMRACDADLQRRHHGLHNMPVRHAIHDGEEGDG